MTSTSGNDAIQPFRIEIPQSDLDDLQSRLGRTRWPRVLPGSGWSRGIDIDYMHDLVDYWKSGFDWRAQEARMNQYPQFTTGIDGQTVHFMHVRSPEPDALPLLLTHGWPSSFAAFIDVIEPLTDPRAHGGNPADAFHVVVPSIPGFGFSNPVNEPGWTTARVAKAFVELMTRLGYERFGAQGEDFGAIISPEIGRIAPDQVVGVHVNAATAGFIPYEDPTDLSDYTEAEQARLARLSHYGAEMMGYVHIQSTRPQTLAYGLADSPAGQLAWNLHLLANPHSASDPIDRDAILTEVTLYWLTNTGGSSAFAYFEENVDPGRWEGNENSGVPTGVAVFADDVSIRRFSEAENTIVHWSEFDRGGHFAAIQAPDLLVQDIQTFFAGLR